MTVQNDVPEWAQIMIDYSKARTKAPLDFKGAKVPKRIQTLLEAAGLKSLEQMEAEVFKVNDDNGWFDDIEKRTIGDDIALLHTEVSEMFEAYRSFGLADATLSPSEDEPNAPIKPEGFGSEAADVFIRLLDTCRRANIHLRSEYERKVAFNRTRGYRHGGKRI